MGFKQYAEFVQARTEDSQALLVQDPRSEDEKIHAEDLQASAKTTQKPPPAFTEDHRPSSRLQSMFPLICTVYSHLFYVI